MSGDGGEAAVAGGVRTHTFTSSGDFSATGCDGSYTVAVLGAGGGGGGNGVSGGGAGSSGSTSSIEYDSTTYSAYAGGGGGYGASDGVSGAAGSNGGTSSPGGSWVLDTGGGSTGGDGAYDAWGNYLCSNGNWYTVEQDCYDHGEMYDVWGREHEFQGGKGGSGGKLSGTLSIEPEGVVHVVVGGGGPGSVNGADGVDGMVTISYAY